MKVVELSVSRTFWEHSGLHAGIDRWVWNLHRELPIPAPNPLPMGEGRCKSRLRDEYLEEN
ncbi:MAG: hypothetical protein IPJ48_03170 [Propionivibrio sp.]|uniref:Uncharacterized protein n=1 Tax=Candidatus Propionivibrio dominans TaxID=2954373 RepID=A0A9D7F4Z6_9RHOO|nr:hypothetical protein [Candidatus Propionivibrio dominans]MBL0166049.1 hypothetical protein [Propionivibrio sp.]